MVLRRVVPFLCIIAAAVPAPARGQDPQPVADRNRRVAVPGLSVLPPQSDNWFLFPVSSSPDNTPGSLIRFVRRLDTKPPTRPEDARQVLAGVLVTDMDEPKSRTPQEFLDIFLQEFVKDGKVRIGEMLTPRQKLVAFESALDSSHGTTCVRYTRLTEITGQFPAFPELIAMAATRALHCAHPRWPQYDITVTYQQLYARGQKELPLDAEANAFLKSVVFTTEKPVGVASPRRHFASLLQSGETAYKARRWTEAQTSFEAAVKAGGFLSPNDPMMAVTLYFLGSTYSNQDRPDAAEVIFRQALDIFGAQTQTDESWVSDLHAQTMNDLGIIYALRAPDSHDPALKNERLNEAERLHLDALALREKTVPNRVDQSLENLKQLYSDWGRWGEAATAGERAVLSLERQRGAEYPEVITRLDDLADIFVRAGRLVDADRIADRLQQHAANLRKAGRDRDAATYDARATAIRADIAKNR